MIRLFGALLILAGIVVMLISFYADSLGYGRYEGVGKDQFVLTAVSFLMQGSGVVLLLAGKGT